jgi:prepilin-type N-terminal cleavage/methylation domain-containing protein
MAQRSRQIHRGFTLVEIMIVISIIAILLAIAVPKFMRSREGAHARACQHNLKQILSAKERWAMEHDRGATDTPNMAGDLVPDYIKTAPICPAGGSYTVGRLDTLPVCSEGGVQGEFNAHVLP